MAAAVENINKDMDIGEALLSETDNRFVLFPIKYKQIWDMYKKAEAAFWTAEELDLSKDWSDWEKLSDNERHFIKYVLAFFAGSDGIVNENLGARFMNEVKPPEAKSFYGFQISMENIHCVAGDTQIYTRTGYFPIEQLAGKTVEVWNGIEFSQATPYRTGTNVDIYRVALTNGAYLDCTSDHKWVIEGVEERVLTKDLQAGATIPQFAFPYYHNMADPDIFSNPHMHGFMAFENPANYVPTMFDCRGQYDVPVNYSISTKTTWLSGVMKHATVNLDNADGAIAIHHHDTTFIKHIGLLLTTLNIHSSVTTTLDGKFCLQINKSYATELASMSNMTIVNWPHIIHHNPPHSPLPPSIKIVSVTQLAIKANTYCFEEPKRHMGIFNGILTGQSETYSILIDTYIKDSQEKYKLLNAINTIPCIRKKADWAIKWIENENAPFILRLVAFACVEGIFFSGAFCAIFWLKERGVMPGLCLSNEFISRDEALHTEFAVLLYSMMTNKLHQDTIHQIVKEAVEIEEEFINESIPCRLLGMNSDLMSQYIQYVADRLVVQLGYDKIWNVTNPFHFMDRINLENKANFFEDRNSQYAMANVGNNDQTNFEFSTEADF